MIWKTQQRSDKYSANSQSFSKHFFFQHFWCSSPTNRSFSGSQMRVLLMKKIAKKLEMGNYGSIELLQSLVKNIKKYKFLFSSTMLSHGLLVKDLLRDAIFRRLSTLTENMRYNSHFKSQSHLLWRVLNDLSIILLNNLVHRISMILGNRP